MTLASHLDLPLMVCLLYLPTQGETHANFSILHGKTESTLAWPTWEDTITLCLLVRVSLFYVMYCCKKMYDQEPINMKWAGSTWGPYQPSTCIFCSFCSPMLTLLFAHEFWCIEGHHWVYCWWQTTQKARWVLAKLLSEAVLKYWVKACSDVSY